MFSGHMTLDILMETKVIINRPNNIIVARIEHQNRDPRTSVSPITFHCGKSNVILIIFHRGGTYVDHNVNIHKLIKKIN